MIPATTVNVADLSEQPAVLPKPPVVSVNVSVLSYQKHVNAEHTTHPVHQILSAVRTDVSEASV